MYMPVVDLPISLHGSDMIRDITTGFDVAGDSDISHYQDEKSDNGAI
jgi:hypothetical protein